MPHDQLSEAIDDPFRTAVLAGLRARERTLPCRYFYDDAGSRLFEQICDLPEYYPTRTEDAILAARAGDLVRALPARDGLELVELGCGNARKTRRLLDALFAAGVDRATYVPVDISATMLDETARSLRREYSSRNGFRVQPLAAEYGPALDTLTRARTSPRCVVFLGSNLGNFAPPEAREFLARVAQTLDARGAAVFGLDEKKDERTLVAAYDDAAGVTAAFNKNILVRMKRELGAQLDLDGFKHEARWNAQEGRMEMHLVSLRAQTVTVGGERFTFRAGEGIHTESSYKYDAARIEDLFGSAGLVRQSSFYDDRKWFGVHVFRRG